MIKEIKYGGDVAEVGFILSEWQKAYLINGSYATRNPGGSIRTIQNDFFEQKKPIVNEHSSTTNI